MSLTLDNNFRRGSSKFEYPNGDVYEGEYVAHRSGLVWKEGYGIYTTNDGQIYKGQWYNDKLTDESNLEINYPDSTTFEGQLKNGQYQGPGSYVVNDMIVSTEFNENKPGNDMTMISPDNRTWTPVTFSSEWAFLLPEHAFLDLPSDFGKGTPKIRDKTTQWMGSTSEVRASKLKTSTMRNLRRLEERIFAKTKKTLSDLQFENSEWYQSYLKFRKSFDEISKKIEESGLESLSEGELAWHEGYLKFRKRYRELMDRSGAKEKLPDFDLMKLFKDEKFKIKCETPVNVIYPSEDNAE